MVCLLVSSFLARVYISLKQTKKYFLLNFISLSVADHSDLPQLFKNKIERRNNGKKTRI